MTPASAVETFDARGYAIIPGVLSRSEIRDVNTSVNGIPRGGAGSRQILDHPWCVELVTGLRRHGALRELIPAAYVAVQCTLFEKDAGHNWLVPFHQDLSIPVRRRVEHPLLQVWSSKEGRHFVQSPRSILEELIAVRLHLDACGVDHGPLRVLAGSHRRGRIAEVAHERTGHDGAEQTCVLDEGGALVLKPLLLHASSKARVPNRRRVLHFLLGPPALPFGLEWPAPVPETQAAPPLQ